MLNTNDVAPDFTLPDSSGKPHQLSKQHGKWLLLYFYPKDDTPGCTVEACMIRDQFPKFQKLGITVWGVSSDSEQSHEKFQKKYELPFSLLSDPDKTVIRAYGAFGEKTFFGKKITGIKRMSFLINPQGQVAKIYKTVKPAEHAERVLKDLENLV